MEIYFGVKEKKTLLSTLNESNVSDVVGRMVRRRLGTRQTALKLSITKKNREQRLFNTDRGLIERRIDGQRLKGKIA